MEAAPEVRQYLVEKQSGIGHLRTPGTAALMRRKPRCWDALLVGVGQIVAISRYALNGGDSRDQVP